MRSAKLALRDRCGQASHQVHQNHRYLVKDLPISGQAVYLEVNRRQFKCKNCGKPFSEELDFVAKRRQYTSRLAQEIVRPVLADDIKTVAENELNRQFCLFAIAQRQASPDRNSINLAS